uniref:non-specific serine/threonine protein kinase n=1 Tax=Timema californicum TaxID=61474 RepID=A0A7R9JFG9_TIMCA|nr:unnamed protein product [Timema californicum]
MRNVEEGEKNPTKRVLNSLLLEWQGQQLIKLLAGSGCFSPISTPNSSRKVLNILQGGLHKMRHVLTPRKKIQTTTALQPTMLATKGLCNVSTTVSNDPKRVLQQLQQALVEKGILCSQEGFKLRGKVQESISSNNIGTSCKLSFELEVCTIPSMSGGESIVVIQRKRLKGDTWFYKKICEEVLALAATE